MAVVTTGLLIDTSALVAIERGATPATELLRDEVVALPSIVLAELLVGVRMADTPARAASRQEKVDDITNRMEIVPFEEGAASHWADLFQELRDAGTPIPSNDLIVASTARLLGYGVLIGPSSEARFSRVPGLRVEVLGA